MLKAMQAVIDEVNKGGGVLGRKIETIVEDDQTNPEAAVRAARKLIEVNKVPVIMGTWASAVTSAVAPVCWEVENLPVHGLRRGFHHPAAASGLHYSHAAQLQAAGDRARGVHRRHGQEKGGRDRHPSAVRAVDQGAPDNVLKSEGAGVVAHVIYEKDKPTYRSEIDQAMRSDPDFLYLNGYAPDTVVVLRDLFKANINLPKFCQSYAVPQKTLDSIPPEVSAGTYTGQPSADIEGRPSRSTAARLGIAEPDSYEAQATDWASLVILTWPRRRRRPARRSRTMCARSARAREQKVYSAVEGLKLLAEGKEINYEGASGPCDFTDIGDIQGCRFRYMEVVDGKLKFLKIV